MKQCEFPGTNHSADLIEVWHGTTEPVYLCGYHVSQGLAPEVYSAIEGKRLAEHSTPLDAIPNDLEDHPQ